MKRSILKWELIGIAAISLFGALLHFAFDWSGGWSPVGVIAAVNESVFEHLKLTYWPALLYAAIENRLLGKSVNNFVIAKTAGLYVMPLAIMAIFYSYTSITGGENLIADITVFVEAIVLGQLTSYKILTMAQLASRLQKLALAGLIALGTIYAVFTFYPPHTPIFMDPITGTYGILQH